MEECIVIKQSSALCGTAELAGAKNAVLVIMASLILTRGKSILTNVPLLNDVLQMIQLLQVLGATVVFNQKKATLEVDTTEIKDFFVSADIMKSMRASVLVMGPLLARLGQAQMGLPGGDNIGARPIDYHLKGFSQLGATCTTSSEGVHAWATQLKGTRIVLEYPSVGATENIMMAAVCARGTTEIINAALEPEVLDLIAVLQKMGALITVQAPAHIIIYGVTELFPVTHTIMMDRLEAGTLLLAAAITGGSLSLPTAPAYYLDLFLHKLCEMGHTIITGKGGVGIEIHATRTPQAVSIKTAPYPGFPTDLQAPMMAALCTAQGTSIVEETVFENRLAHVAELNRLGARIEVFHNKATIVGVPFLQGVTTTATDIRASCALVLAGLAAQGTTRVHGLNHFRRGYDTLDEKLIQLGARISIERPAPRYEVAHGVVEQQV